MPISADKLEDINSAQEIVGAQATIRLMVDHAEQIRILYGSRVGDKMVGKSRWSQADEAGRRAGAPAESEQMKELIQALVESQDYVEIFGRLRTILCLRFPFSWVVLLRWRD